MKSRYFVLALLIPALVIGALVMQGQFSSATEPHGNLSLDAVPGGSTASSVGTIDSTAEITDSPGGAQVSIDLVIGDASSSDATGASGGIPAGNDVIAWQVDIAFDPSVLTLKGFIVKDCSEDSLPTAEYFMEKASPCTQTQDDHVAAISPSPAPGIGTFLLGSTFSGPSAGANGVGLLSTLVFDAVSADPGSTCIVMVADSQTFFLDASETRHDWLALNSVKLGLNGAPAPAGCPTLITPTPAATVTAVPTPTTTSGPYGFGDPAGDLGLDAVPGDNTASSVGEIDTTRSVTGVPGGGAELRVDLVIGDPGSSDTTGGSGGIPSGLDVQAWQTRVEFDPNVLRFVGFQMKYCMEDPGQGDPPDIRFFMEKASNCDQWTDSHQQVVYPAPGPGIGSFLVGSSLVGIHPGAIGVGLVAALIFDVNTSSGAGTCIRLTDLNPDLPEVHDSFYIDVNEVRHLWTSMNAISVGVNGATAPAGCAVATTPTPSPTAMPTPTPTPSPTPAWTPTPTAAPTPTPFPGTTFTNNTGVSANDLHFYAGQPQMSLAAEVTQNAPGCSAPTVSATNYPGPDFTFKVDVVWPEQCVDGGESVTLTFTCSNPGTPQLCSPSILNNCVDWTVSGGVIGSACPTPPPGGTPTPSPSPTHASPTPTPTPTSGPTPTPTLTPTPTPIPPGIHDAAVKRIGSPRLVRLSPGAADTKAVTIIVRNEGDHADDIGVYLAFVPPGGEANPGGCSPAKVLNWVDYATGGAQSSLTGVPAGGRVSLRANVDWSCANPAAVDGQNWTLKAIADHGADDFASCDTVSQVFIGACESALMGDDASGGSNTMTRPLPIVRYVP